MLWQQFDPEDIADIDPDTDHFTDPTKPGVPTRTFKHIKPTPISIALPKPDLKRKQPLAEDYLPQIQPITYDDFWRNFGECPQFPAQPATPPPPSIRQNSTVPLSNRDSTVNPLIKSSPRLSPPITTVPSRPQTVHRSVSMPREHSSVELSPRDFWKGEPLERDPAPPRAAKHKHFWRPEFDSDYEADTDRDELYNATPPP